MSSRVALPLRSVLETDAGRLSFVAAVTALLLILMQNGPNSPSSSGSSTGNQQTHQPVHSQSPQSQLNWGANSNGATQVGPSGGHGIVDQFLFLAARSIFSSQGIQVARGGKGSQQLSNPTSCSGIKGRLVPKLGHRLDPPATACRDVSGAYVAIKKQPSVVASQQRPAQKSAALAPSTTVPTSVPMGSKNNTLAPLRQRSSTVSRGLEGLWSGTATVGNARYHYEWEIVSEVGSRVSGLVHISPDRGAPLSTYKFVGTIDGSELLWSGTEWVKRQFRQLCIASGNLNISKTKLIGVWHGGGSAPGSCPASSSGKVELFKSDPAQTKPIQSEPQRVIKKAL